MKVLITGSSGRIGGAVFEGAERDHEVIGLDVQPGAHTSVVGSITDRRLVERLCAQVEAVIHTASLHAPHVGVAKEAEFRRVNVQGTGTLLEACRNAGVSRFVYTSTTSLYGHALVPGNRAVWVTEELEPRPRDIYDVTKIAAEQECAKAAEAGMACLSLRMSRCFPEPEDLMAIYRLYRGVDVRDVARAHCLALTVDLEGFDVFNISAATPFREADTVALMNDAAEVIRSYHPWIDEEFARRGWRLPSSIDRVYVTDKAQGVLGFKPEHDFADLLGMP